MGQHLCRVSAILALAGGTQVGGPSSPARPDHFNSLRCPFVTAITAFQVGLPIYGDWHDLRGPVDGWPASGARVSDLMMAPSPPSPRLPFPPLPTQTHTHTPSPSEAPHTHTHTSLHYQSITPNHDRRHACPFVWPASSTVNKGGFHGARRLFFASCVGLGRCKGRRRGSSDALTSRLPINASLPNVTDPW